MTITIEITPELEHQLQQAAAQAGLSVDAYILESVAQRLAPVSQQLPPRKHLTKRESLLLQKINQSLSQIEWLRYRELLNKRQAQTLSSMEQVELIALSNQIEEANAQRIQSIAELASIRKTTLPALMRELGLKPIAYV